jgi:hypothetical protein
MHVCERRSKLPSYGACALINPANVVTSGFAVAIISTSKITLGRREMLA